MIDLRYEKRTDSTANIKRITFKKKAIINVHLNHARRTVQVDFLVTFNSICCFMYSLLLLWEKQNKRQLFNESQ